MEFHGPSTVDEAVSLLAADEDARCLAGGATLVAMMNADLVMPSALVSLRHIEALRGIATDSGGGLRIGAMATHREVAGAAGLDGAHALISETARAIGHPAIRNMGTIGGSIGHGDPQADYPGALVALDAAVELRGADGARAVAAQDFFVDYLETALRPGELIAAVTLPPSPAGGFGAYEKFARVEGDYATVSVAAVVAMEGGNCSYVRVALGSCGPTPVRAEEAEARLAGTALGDEDIADAAAILRDACDPVDDVRGSGEYRMMLVEPLLGRALRAAAKRGVAR